MAQPPINIALIICSTRSPRVGPSVSSWVASTINSVLPQYPNTTLTVLDLADHPLPISPGDAVIPGHQPVPLAENCYGNAAVNAWSRAVRQHQGFIFVTPQYNWSFPAAVKCAIDHLFHEWVGKPAMIVSYGTRGGGRANAQLRQVCLGTRMDPWEGKVELAIGREGLDEGVLQEGVVDAWEGGEKRAEVVRVWGEMIKLLGGKGEKGEV
jgi:NAD(P)H-dependent FMN reductase